MEEKERCNRTSARYVRMRHQFAIIYESHHSAIGFMAVDEGSGGKELLSASRNGIVESFNGKLWDQCRNSDLPPAVRPPFEFLHADKLIGAKVRASEAGGRYPSALCGHCVL